MSFRIADLFCEFRAKGLTQLSASMGKLRGSLAGLSTSMSRVSQGVRLGMMVVAGGLGAGAMAAASFEKQMAHVSTMLNKTNMKDLPRLSEGIRKLSRDFGQSTASLTSGLHDFLSAGMSTRDSMAALEAATKLAVGGFTDSAKTTRTLISTLNSYGIAGRDAAKVSDMMFAAYQKGVFTMDELASTLGTVTSTAAMAGIPLGELLALIATVTQKGVPMHQTMTGVTGLFMSFTTATEEAKKAFQDLFDKPMTLASLKTIGLTKLMKKLNSQTADQVATMFPNRRAIKAVAAALQDASTVGRHHNYIMNETGLTQEALGKAADTTAHQLDVLKYTFLDILRSIGDGLLPEIRRLADWMKGLTDRMVEWVRENRLLFASITKLAALALGAAAAFVIVSKTIGAAVAVFGMFKAVIAVTVAALGVVGSALAVLLSPIGLVVAAIAGMAAYFVISSGAMGEAIKWLKDRFAELSDFAGRSFKAIGDALAAGDIGLAANVFWQTLKLAWQTGITALKGQWFDWKASFLDTATDAFYGVLVLSVQITSKLKSVWAEAMGAIKKTAYTTAEGFAHIGNEFKYAMGKITKEEFVGNRAWIIAAANLKLAGVEEESAKRLADIEGDKQFLLTQASKKAADARTKHAKESAGEQLKIEKDLANARIAWRKAVEDAEGASLRAARRRPLGPDDGPPGAPGAPEAPEPETIRVIATLDRGSWSGLADVWKNIQTAIMGKDPHLKEAKKQTGVLENIRDAVKDLDVSSGAAVTEGGV